MFKKFFVFFSLALLLISNSLLGSAFADGATENNSEYTIDHISSEDLYLHPDVVQFLEDNKSTQYILDDEQPDNALISLYGLDEKVSLPEVNDTELTRLESEYGLERPNTEILESNQDILIQRNQLQSVVNVWYVTYFATNSGFTVNVNGVGSSSIAFSGKLTNHRASGYGWQADKSVNFTKNTKTNGIVYNWALPRTYVSDYFTYDIKATSNGTTYNYSRSDNYYQRYNFAVGTYSGITASGGERHHFVSKDALGKASFNTNAAPSVRMITPDHAKTKSWGNSFESGVYRAKELELLKKKDYVALIRLEVQGFKDSVDPAGKFSSLESKYYDALVQVILLTEKYFGI
ncbi:hypothetical protein P5G61_05825 [Paenibacillus sp. F6_3S_P_1C]|jgi:hypothetical protein|uniref:Uncharacterized protein n=1 Tax=Paenibacillus vandeheii TaxID=3035917 RepID=A0ABT8J7X9_9BACL|nr:hypothetical protein [Paenibacillus vandeheii]MDN4600736.1 hypothetical protein [Paenibacillus vandeheii]